MNSVNIVTTAVILLKPYVAV